MNLKTVTITGADDAVDPQDLVALARAYPFCEIGILMSIKHGKPRFPSRGWIDRLYDAIQDEPCHTALAVHICGQWVLDLLVGRWDCAPSIPSICGRIQINCGSNPGIFDRHRFVTAMRHVIPGTTIIIQSDGINDHILDASVVAGINAKPLFDRSGGRGVLPDRGWPAAYVNGCGYAGGLNPSNVAEQLAEIAKVCGQVPIWIDAETGLRDEKDKFSLIKAEAFLKAAKQFVSKEVAHAD